MYNNLSVMQANYSTTCNIQNRRQ